MGKPEADVEGRLIAGVAQRGGWAAKMEDRGRRGAPDRELRFPGFVMYVETKANGGVLKPWQANYHHDLRALGFIVLVLWTEAQVDLFFERYDTGMYR